MECERMLHNHFASCKRQYCRNSIIGQQNQYTECLVSCVFSIVICLNLCDNSISLKMNKMNRRHHFHYYYRNRYWFCVSCGKSNSFDRRIMNHLDDTILIYASNSDWQSAKQQNCSRNPRQRPTSKTRSEINSFQWK